MSGPADILAHVLAADPATPRLTMYDDDRSSPSAGERIELSAKVLGIWVAKAGNALQEEYDLGPGTRIALRLPPHWRTAYWALAAWSVGAAVVLGSGARDADLVITAEVSDLGGSDGIVVTLPALARRALVPVPEGAMDEAQELASFGDRFEAWARPGEADPALIAQTTTTYAAWRPKWELPPGVRAHTATDATLTFLEQLLSSWAAGGSLVLTRGRPDAGALAARLASEAVTLEL